MELAQDQVERQTRALETTARNTDTLVLIVQLWSFAAVIGVIIYLISAANGGS